MSTVSNFTDLFSALASPTDNEIILGANITLKNTIFVANYKEIAFAGSKLAAGPVLGITSMDSGGTFNGRSLLDINVSGDGAEINAGTNHYISIRNCPGYDGDYEVHSSSTEQIIVFGTFGTAPSGGELCTKIHFWGLVRAPRTQIFSGTWSPRQIDGSFRSSAVCPEWWGLETGYHDKAINNAIQAFGPENGNVVSLDARTYDVSAPLDLRRTGSRLAGAGRNATFIRTTDNWTPAEWEDEYIFSQFTGTERNFAVGGAPLSDCHSAVIWMGSRLSHEGQSFRTAISGLTVSAAGACLKNPGKYISCISSTGWVEENSIIEDVHCRDFTGFGIGFHSTLDHCTINGLSVRDFRITHSWRRESIPIYIPTHAVVCEIRDGVIDVSVNDNEAFGGAVHPPRDWPTAGIVASGNHTSIDHVHLEGMGMGIYVYDFVSPSAVTVTNITGRHLMDSSMFSTDSARIPGPPPSLTNQAAAFTAAKPIKRVKRYGKNIASVTGAGVRPIVVTVTNHELPEGLTHNVKITGVNSATNGTWTVKTVPGNDHDLILVNSSSGGSYSSGGVLALPVTVECPGHGLGHGSQGVVVAGLTDGEGFDAFDGTWTVSVVDEDHFSLDGTAGQLSGTFDVPSCDGTVALTLPVSSIDTSVNPVRLTTATKHGYVTDMLVDIRGASGLTNGTSVAGTWAVTRISDTVFSIPPDCTANTGNYNSNSGKISFGRGFIGNHPWYRRYSSLVVIARTVDWDVAGYNNTTTVVLRNLTSLGGCKYLVRDGFVGVEPATTGSRPGRPNSDLGCLVSYDRTTIFGLMEGEFPYTTVAITAVANAGPPVLLTSTAHGLSSSGDPVLISGVGGAVDGWKTARYYDDNTIKIDGVTGPAAGAVTATARRFVKVTGITGVSGDMVFTTATPHGLSNGDPVVVSGVRSLTGTNPANGSFSGSFSVTNAGADPLQFTIPDKTPEPYIGGGCVGKIDVIDATNGVFYPQARTGKTYKTTPVII